MPKKNRIGNQYLQSRGSTHVDKDRPVAASKPVDAKVSSGLLRSSVPRNSLRHYLFLAITGLIPMLLLAIPIELLARRAGSETPPPGKEVNNFRCIPSANPEMTYQIAPNSSFITLGVPFTTNEYGFRDQPVFPKIPGIFRILCIGDSVTYGTGVTNQETFPNVLEAMLQQRAGKTLKVDAINAGVSAYNIRNIRAQLETILDTLQPDVVLYTFVENDLDDSLSVAPSGDLFFYDPVKPPDTAFIYGAFAPHWLNQKKRLDEQMGGFAISRKFSQWWNAIPDIAPPLGMGTHAEAQARWRWVSSELERMRDLCTKRNARFSVMTFGTRNHSEPIHRKVQQACQLLGLPVCSTLPLFDHHEYMATHSLGYDSHCNPAALRMMANRLYTFFEDQQVLPPACMRHTSDRQIYDETLDTAYTDHLEQECLQAPEEITFTNGAGIIGVMGGIDPQGRMARNCIFRLSGPGTVLEVDTNSLLAGHGEPQTLSARFEGGNATVPVMVPGHTTRLAFAIPENLWNQTIEVELIAGGPSHVPPPQERVMGAMPYTIALHRLAKARGQ